MLELVDFHGNISGFKNKKEMSPDQQAIFNTFARTFENESFVNLMFKNYPFMPIRVNLEGDELAMYLDPWHADVFSIHIKNKSGDECVCITPTAVDGILDKDTLNRLSTFVNRFFEGKDIQGKINFTYKEPAYELSSSDDDPKL